MAVHRIHAMQSSSVYPHDVTRAERKGLTRAEVDQIICWLTGYDLTGLQRQLDQGTDFRTIFAEAPAFNSKSRLITGVVCGVRVEEVEDPLMRKLRCRDKLMDELALGKAMDRILRQ